MFYSSPEQQSAAQERTHLLSDPVCNNPTIQRGVVPEDYHYGSVPKESEEQAGLNRILDEISSWVLLYFKCNVPLYGEQWLQANTHRAVWFTLGFSQLVQLGKQTI